ncbi:MAG: hypothetical protein [Olavius algarvensis Gamma 1 endosymbiont]|nr:MAG: hypothetical protein [Olavius algarvensis Gamma 1 endosymbiont]
MKWGTSFDQSCTFEAPTSSSMRFALLTASYRSYSAGILF